MALRISQLAKATGVAPDTIRYYERLGIITPPRRTPAGYRLYGPAEVERLAFIKGAQSVGLRLRDVGELLQIRDRGLCPCGHTEALIRQRTQELDEQINQLRTVRDELDAMSRRLPTNCPDGEPPWACDREFIRLGRR